MLRDPGRATQIELQDIRNHNDGLRLISIFKKGEPERCCTVNKQATGKVLLVLNNPVTAAVFANKEEGRFWVITR